ncbi:RNA polymerase sigma factor SigX [Paenisporosarcina cavernae]|uniref:Sigma-70 family RNA polymerase sigma factor n=1 Tax=Paenisporosarcina cavernae TaxID=2320858 RepID=A0A385YRJ2_9BACL|nr:RNA polymerase sigma factor SigX [Paenisporosarcina cavernae]AYC29359.1 sigma-70 family RNA polymerase sigma factor [Paenisporosarcina cavernae]
MNDSVFNRLYDQYHQDVFQFLIYLVTHRETAEDLMHEVYVRVLKAYDKFEGKSSEKTWLFSIAKNVSIDHFRKTNVRKKYSFDLFDWDQNQLSSNEILPDDKVMMKEETEKLIVALEQCTVDQKMVIILRYLQDLSISETASVLGWTEGKVKTTQHRGIQKLKSIFQMAEKEES